MERGAGGGVVSGDHGHDRAGIQVHHAARGESGDSLAAVLVRADPQRRDRAVLPRRRREAALREPRGGHAGAAGPAGGVPEARRLRHGHLQGQVRVPWRGGAAYRVDGARRRRHAERHVRRALGQDGAARIPPGVVRAGRPPAVEPPNTQPDADGPRAEPRRGPLRAGGVRGEALRLQGRDRRRVRPGAAVRRVPGHNGGGRDTARAEALPEGDGAVRLLGSDANAGHSQAIGGGDRRIRRGHPEVVAGTHLRRAPDNRRGPRNRGDRHGRRDRVPPDRPSGGRRRHGGEPRLPVRHAADKGRELVRREAELRVGHRGHPRRPRRRRLVEGAAPAPRGRGARRDHDRGRGEDARPLPAHLRRHGGRDRGRRAPLRGVHLHLQGQDRDRGRRGG